MSARRNGLGDFNEVQIHRLGIAGGQNEGRTWSGPLGVDQ